METPKGLPLPSRIKVGGYVYDVKVVKKYLIVGGHECSGMITYGQHLIEIRDKSVFDEQSQSQTFLHELLHAIERDREMELGEETIETLAKGLIAFCRDNDFWFREG